MINFTYRAKVYYKDVDKMGVVYYARYFEYFEAARTELLQSISLDVTTIENEGYYLPVITSHCDYKSGANFEDELSVKLAINKPPKSTMKIDYEVYRSSNEELLVTGYTIHAFTDQSGKAVKPPKRLLEAIQKNS
ncbi:MAG: thioesterase family protein [Candidatus Neomarinimicrobiota bacterium]|nr:thioesterase family protein [Candidatus Neomarinimicrobiota bacterium]